MKSRAFCPSQSRRLLKDLGLRWEAWGGNRRRSISTVKSIALAREELASCFRYELDTRLRRVCPQKPAQVELLFSVVPVAAMAAVRIAKSRGMNCIQVGRQLSFGLSPTCRIISLL